MSYIGKNIKKIRTVKKLSQAAFADMFNLARPSVGAYEEGRSEPKIDTIIAIATHFSLSTDALLRKELTVNELYSLDILKGEFDPTAMPPALGKSTTQAFQASLQSHAGIPLIEKQLVFEYIVNKGNRDFIQNLKRILLPAEGKGVFRAFEHHNDEMYYHDGGLRDGDILLSREIDIDNLKKIRPDSVYVAVLHEGIFTRRIVSIDPKNVQFRVDNPAYEDVTISKDDLIEIWEVVGVWSKVISEPPMIEQRLMKLEDLVGQLQKKIKLWGEK